MAPGFDAWENDHCRVETNIAQFCSIKEQGWRSGISPKVGTSKMKSDRTRERYQRTGVYRDLLIAREPHRPLPATVAGQIDLQRHVNVRRIFLFRQRCLSHRRSIDPDLGPWRFRDQVHPPCGELGEREGRFILLEVDAPALFRPSTPLETDLIMSRRQLHFRCGSLAGAKDDALGVAKIPRHTCKAG